MRNKWDILLFGDGVWLEKNLNYLNQCKLVGNFHSKVWSQNIYKELISLVFRQKSWKIFRILPWCTLGFGWDNTKYNLKNPVCACVCVYKIMHSHPHMCGFSLFQWLLCLSYVICCSHLRTWVIAFWIISAKPLHPFQFFCSTAVLLESILLASSLPYLTDYMYMYVYTHIHTYSFAAVAN